MNLKDILEIILITYNRKENLKATMAELLAETSPVKDFDITILDNASTDGTSEYIAELAQKHTNLKHIRNKKNIGGNANIARAFELSSKKYLWILADDDTYDFSAWNEVEKAIKEDSDLIIVNTEIIKGEMNTGKMIRLLTFLPANIFKAENFTDETLININYNALNWFPHLGAIIEIINNKGKIYTCGKNIVITGDCNHDGIEFHRKTKKLHEPFKLIFFEAAYLNSCAMIADKKIRSQACENFASGRFFKDVLNTFKKNIIEYDNNFRNYALPFCSLDAWQKIRFATAVLINHIVFLALYPKYRRKKQNFLKRLEEVSK